MSKHSFKIGQIVVDATGHPGRRGNVFGEIVAIEDRAVSYGDGVTSFVKVRLNHSGKIVSYHHNNIARHDFFERHGL